jgi:hypothetical protein
LSDDGPLRNYSSRFHLDALTLFLEWGWFVEGTCDGGKFIGFLGGAVTIWPLPANTQQDARAQQRLPTRPALSDLLRGRSTIRECCRFAGTSRASRPETAG